MHDTKDICEAITQKNCLTIAYDGGYPRDVEPHCLGMSTAGNVVLRAYQVNGDSVSGEQEGWKLFLVDRINQMEVEQRTFDGPRPGYNPQDSAMEEVYCCL